MGWYMSKDALITFKTGFQTLLAPATEFDNINLTFNFVGEVHCLAGKNGCAGHLSAAISVHPPEKGAEIIINGQSYNRLTPAAIY